MKKRLLSVLLTFSVAIAAVGCGKANTDNQKASDSAAPAAQGEKTAAKDGGSCCH